MQMYIQTFFTVVRSSSATVASVMCVFVVTGSTLAGAVLAAGFLSLSALSTLSVTLILLHSDDLLKTIDNIRKNTNVVQNVQVPT